MITDYQLWEIADLLRYSTQLSISKSTNAIRISEYCLRLFVEVFTEDFISLSVVPTKIASRFHVFGNISTNTFLYNVRTDSDKVEDIPKIHRKLFRSDVFDEVAQPCAIIFRFAQLTFPSSSSHFD
ncbi:hypothetical protein T10_7720 [Trichinella papuae]|uniref:Uncharacterized protein n=1 Tax=Trichinella papuae TaxID=268474 RepID=A0A0V1M0H5_9BILA|nr:hypothetical protein T10_7720 [Trichinella papuae]